MPVALSFLYPCGSGGAALVLIPLSFMAMPSMIMISSQSDQYGYRSFCISALANCHPCNMSSDSMPMCLSTSVAFLILSCCHACTLVCLCITTVLMVMHMSGVSSSLFVWWLCLDSYSVMNNCDPGMYSILVLY